ncbi:MAG: type IV pilus assembly protein PilM [Actinobacteria bacterium]|nr:type IV pilus assembly protein PilM [Actinomycetota bacterium]
MGFLDNIFPQKTLIGLDIGAGNLRVVCLKPSSDTPILTTYGSIKIPKGAVVEGEIIDIETVAASIAGLWKKTGLKEKNATVGIASQKVIVRLVELPFMEEEELKGAIQYQAQEFIAIPTEEAILDFQVVNEFVDEEENHKIEVLLIAAQKDLVQSYVSTLNAAGLEPEVIDVSSFAMVRSLISSSSVVNSKEDALVLINISTGTTNIVVVENGIPKFTRVTTLAGDSFTQSLVDFLEIPFDEAEDLKIKLGLPPVDEENPLKKESNLSEEETKKIKLGQEVLTREIFKFIDEVRRSLDYYLTQTKNTNIRNIILTGNGSRLKNLPLYLEKGLQLKVGFGHPLAKIKIDSSQKEAVEKDELSLAISIGLALRGTKNDKN